jgi:hypothetical protein
MREVPYEFINDSTWRKFQTFEREELTKFITSIFRYCGFASWTIVFCLTYFEVYTTFKPLDSP